MNLGRTLTQRKERLLPSCRWTEKGERGEMELRRERKDGGGIGYFQTQREGTKPLLPLLVDLAGCHEPPSWGQPGG